ncbi:hypothetical protein DYQ86_16065 [Acidobacteria bacterium AB60]|nr:hypothetical protein DYQ86_16065 [Acidobacteria bacterium AB60]
MTGLWRETLDRCEFDLEYARKIEGHDPERARLLTERALADAECVTMWSTMTDALMEAQQRSREDR